MNLVDLVESAPHVFQELILPRLLASEFVSLRQTCATIRAYVRDYELTQQVLRERNTWDASIGRRREVPILRNGMPHGRVVTTIFDDRDGVTREKMIELYVNGMRHGLREIYDYTTGCGEIINTVVFVDGKKHGTERNRGKISEHLGYQGHTVTHVKNYDRGCLHGRVVRICELYGKFEKIEYDYHRGKISGLLRVTHQQHQEPPTFETYDSEAGDQLLSEWMLFIDGVFIPSCHYRKGAGNQQIAIVTELANVAAQIFRGGGSEVIKRGLTWDYGWIQFFPELDAEDIYIDYFNTPQFNGELRVIDDEVVEFLYARQ
jgi:hypothetical protein